LDGDLQPPRSGNYGSGNYPVFIVFATPKMYTSQSVFSLVRLPQNQARRRKFSS